MATEGTSTSGALHQQWLKQIDTALRTQGQPAAAAHAVQAVAAGVDHPAVLNLAAQSHFGDGRIEEAASMLRRARKLAPNDAHVLNSLAICEQALGRVEAALDAYSAALRADPSLAAAHYNRGSLVKETGDVAAAREDFVAAIALDRNYV
ncbi:MAG TPA: tetratricopeptide repeat protein, partial [Sphingomicrobium sp.]|nr:tetratricopeptide repeat protein [Sphingomicrobium sp.]